ncbi:GntR family transcriptional regulator [Tardiphaga sp. vice352]|uniref:GntR family transcriptional regulator n=1 Tax=unclassified Tardiphaga TaxID=2631404 RepID=UPI001161FAC7|nr:MULTISPECIES: GntR family transcriptional regulator [unclassified Tardiphaga]QDM18936.1 GntR family transcriptional regulator [Tardiphaga sp. vice278]QDM23921.1 GntR family transcriptional regulator [Tardiphaga sp. vice154]QDM29142.1 GntR family transcriptional regulator [Tardiphaga sp. vice304]QDM34242.1 GntR family transcriptional regulator [Tardiphaga sp. vice352]
MADIAPPPPFEPAALRAGNRSLSVMDEIRDAILNGSVHAGERINEVRFSKTLAVSRTPVRAALQALAGEGLLDYAPNRGFTVREFPLDAIVDAYEIRASLEGVAARFAAERGLSAEERAVIERSLVAGDALLAPGHFEAGAISVYRGINGDFHETLLAAARNRMLAEMIRICHHVPMSSSRNIVAFEHRDVRRRHDDHHRIYEAILAREPHRAEILMREHVAGVKASLVKSLTGRDEQAAGEALKSG